MKHIHTIQRANSTTKYDHKVSNKIKHLIEIAPTKLARGNKPRKLSIRICDCGKMHWGERNARLIGKQKIVARMCPDCFFAAYKKNRPRAYRFLSVNEREGYIRSLEVSGVKSYFVDPSIFNA